MYKQVSPRRPWRGSATCCWVPDKMVSPVLRLPSERGIGNDHAIYKTARTKQRRLGRHLVRLDTAEWDE